MQQDDSLPSEQPGLLLHIGAGTGTQLQSQLAGPWHRIVLIEPNPDRADTLRTKLTGLTEADSARVQVLEMAVAQTDGTAPLNIFNLADVSSLGTPDRLFELYPGLRRIGRPTVTTISPETLLADLDIADGATHHLVLEAPGQDAVILRGLFDLGVLHRFSQITLRCGVEALFEGASPAREILSWLEQAGYRQGSVRAQADPDWLDTMLDLNPLLPRITALTQTCSDLEAQLAQAQAATADQASDHAEALAALRAECDALRADLQDETQARIAANMRADELARQRATDQQELHTQKARADALTAEHEAVSRALVETRAALQTALERQDELARSRDEIIRAEGQIGLIKDLLLSGPGL